MELKLKRTANSRMGMEGLHGMTSKLTVGLCDVYLKTAWVEGKIVRIDITLSRGQGDIDQSAYYLARAWVEDSCRMASKLLERGAPIEEICSMWVGVEGFPNGFCPQLEGIMKGPLHAVAMHIRKRHDVWKWRIEQLTSRVAESKIQESQEAVEG